MKKHSSIRITLATFAAVFALAACGNPGNNNFVAPPTGTATAPPTPPPAPTPPPTPTGDGTPQGQAGAGFATAFNQSPFDEPVDPIAGDIIPLDKTAEPIPIPNP